MKMYIPFGDWSDDGHGKYERVLVEAPSMEWVKDAQDCILKLYGKNFFETYAQNYEEPTLSKENWKALIDCGYPIERLAYYDDVNDWTDVISLEEALMIDYNPHVSLEFVIDSFIWLLNKFGAKIERLDEKEDIPMICNWTCKGFKTVGYGCFW